MMDENLMRMHARRRWRLCTIARITIELITEASRGRPDRYKALVKLAVKTRFIEDGPQPRDVIDILHEARAGALDRRVVRAVATAGPDPVIERIARNAFDELAIQADVSGFDLGVNSDAIYAACGAGEATPQAALEDAIDAYARLR